MPRAWFTSPLDAGTPWWLPGGHAQTIWPLALDRDLPRYRRERLDTPDGDFIDLDWLTGGSIDAPLLVLFHGLEGSSGSPYARSLMRALSASGWRGVVANFRGCSGEPNRLARAYHSGDSEEIDWILRQLHPRAGDAPLFAAGVSLGGNALLKWLGERELDACRILAGAAAICPPLDLALSGRALGRGFNRLYTAHFLRTLKPKALAKLERHPTLFDPGRLREARSLHAFDDIYTGPVHGFAGADDYWRRASSKPYLRAVRVPTLLLCAANDPFVPAGALPSAGELSRAIHFDCQPAGGHVGFVRGAWPGHIDWLPARLLAHFGRASRSTTRAPQASAIMRRIPSAHLDPESSMTSAPYALPAPEIFKAYDIRGIVDKTLTPDAVRAIGHALGSEARARSQRAIAVGRDGRLSGPELAGALADGIRAAGVDVVDIGCVPTPLTYFAAYRLGTDSCVSVTGSHNPPDYNGLKMVLGGETLFGEQILALRRRIADNDLTHGAGAITHADVVEAYLERIVGDVKLARPMKIVIDCGNGVAGAIAPSLFKRLGCELVELFCEVDGTFPNHHPDPSKPENLQDVVRALRETDAELGLAFDGDGDRLGVATKDGKIIYPDRQLMLFAADVLERVPGGEIIYDVKCTRNLAGWIRRHGGVPTMWNTGHALVKAKLRENGAPLAGEMSGHVFFKERWFGFDDGLYAGARLLEILSRSADPSAVLKALPDALSTPELNLKMAEGEPFELVRRLRESARFTNPRQVVTIDGVRVEYADGFGLARPSNTTPVVVLRFEADSEAAIARIKSDFRRAIDAVWPGLELPF